MRKALRKILKKLHLGSSSFSLKSRGSDMRGKSSLTSASIPPADITGQTVFDDRPLRFKNLSLTEGDMSPLDDSAEMHGAFKIRVAKHIGARREAITLVHRRYAKRGYQTPGQKRDPYLSTFVAYDEGQIVGTVGVRLDAGKGLSADELYGTEIGILRGSGSIMCEFTRLAVDSTAASKPVLAGLFHTAYLYASVINGCTHAVIEVNPRHVAYYQRALNFAPIGPERMNARVHAPAVLLCVPFATIAEGLARYAGKTAAHGARRSLFLYGFPPNEEVGVLKRLRDLIEAKQAATSKAASALIQDADRKIGVF